MTPPVRPDQNDPLPPPAEDSPGVLVWMIAGGALVLVYIAVLALLHPTR